MADAVGEATGERREHGADGRRRGQAEPGASGDQPHTSTKNDGISTSQPNDDPTIQRLGEVADGEAAQAEQVEIEQRCRVAGRADEERRQQHGGDDEAGRACADRSSPTAGPARRRARAGPTADRRHRHGDGVEALAGALALGVAEQDASRRRTRRPRTGG